MENFAWDEVFHRHQMPHHHDRSVEETRDTSSDHQEAPILSRASSNRDLTPPTPSPNIPPWQFNPSTFYRPKRYNLQRITFGLALSFTTQTNQMTSVNALDSSALQHPHTTSFAQNKNQTPKQTFVDFSTFLVAAPATTYFHLLVCSVPFHPPRPRTLHAYSSDALSTNVLHVFGVIHGPARESRSVLHHMPVEATIVMSIALPYHDHLSEGNTRQLSSLDILTLACHLSFYNKRETSGVGLLLKPPR